MGPLWPQNVMHGGIPIFNSLFKIDLAAEDDIRVCTDTSGSHGNGDPSSDADVSSNNGQSTSNDWSRPLQLTRNATSHEPETNTWGTAHVLENPPNPALNGTHVSVPIPGRNGDVAGVKEGPCLSREVEQILEQLREREKLEKQHILEELHQEEVDLSYV